MSSLLKTFYNNALYHRFKNGSGAGPHHQITSADIRFTKVLTKYSTEYNNSIFIQRLCNQMLMDQKDLVEFFKDIKDGTDKGKKCNDAMMALFEQCEITKLDIDRMYRYIDKFSESTSDAAAAVLKCGVNVVVSGLKYKKKRGIFGDDDDEYESDDIENEYSL
jgi:hypothetical protein